MPPFHLIMKSVCQCACASILLSISFHNRSRYSMYMKKLLLRDVRGKCSFLLCGFIEAALMRLFIKKLNRTTHVSFLYFFSSFSLVIYHHHECLCISRYLAKTWAGPGKRSIYIPNHTFSNECIQSIFHLVLSNVSCLPMQLENTISLVCGYGCLVLNHLALLGFQLME